MTAKTPAMRSAEMTVMTNPQKYAMKLSRTIVTCLATWFVFSITLHAQYPGALLHPAYEPYDDKHNVQHPVQCSHAKKAAGLQNVMSAISSPTFYRPQSFDVLSYDVSLNIGDAPLKRIRASTCQIKIRWLTTPDTFRFHLRSLSVDTVTSTFGSFQQNTETATASGTPADADFHYTIAASKFMKVGDTVTYAIRYSGTMTGEPLVNGFSWGGVQSSGTSLYALGVGFGNNYVSATSHWMPCYDHPSDKATFRAAFICPIGYTVASNGLLINVDTVREISETFLRFTWEMKSPAATYLLTFAADKYHRLSYQSQSTSPVPIEVYAQAVDTSQTRRSFRLLPRMVTSYEKLFGDFPFEKVGFANTQLGAMEHQTMVCYPTSLSRSGDTVNSVAAHELAHQWFGDLVTAYDFRDGWLSESFATYGEALWAEELGGDKGYIDNIQKQINDYFSRYSNPQSPYFEGILPTYDYPRTPPSSNYPRAIYERGSIILGMLRSYIGDTSFFQGMTEYLTRSRFANATYDSVRTAFERTAPTQLRDSIAPYLRQWIKGKGWATLSINSLKFRQQNGEWKMLVSMRQVQPDSFGIYTILPFELSLRTRTGELQHYPLLLSSLDTTIEFTNIGDVTAISINTGSKVRSLVKIAATPTITSADIEQSTGTVTVYPNPASDVAWIDCTRAGIPSVSTVTVYDALGRTVQHFTTPETTSLIPLQTQSLANGRYMVVISSTTDSQTVTLTIVR
ncbi:MAG: T9SS type A sorting domain-containing protein [Candidatus Kapabacteria bacterium]|nr:T9SS type A sorting domain-containing protein [Candidatus Kapabacteria bacterium]